MNAKSARNSNLKIQNLNSQINIEWILNLFRCPSKSKSHATCILKMEYQSVEQRRKFASEFSEVVVQSSAAIFGLAFAGTTNEPANTGRTSCSGYPSSVASSQQGLYSYLPALGFFFHWIIQLNLFQSCHYILRKQFDVIYQLDFLVRKFDLGGLIDLHLLFILHAFLFVQFIFNLLRHHANATTSL